MSTTFLTFGGISTPRNSPTQRIRVFHKAQWDDPAWLEIDGARLDFASWSVAPTIPKAQFSRRFGVVSESQVGGFVHRARLDEEDMSGHYVKIYFEQELVNGEEGPFGLITADGNPITTSSGDELVLSQDEPEPVEDPNDPFVFELSDASPLELSDGNVLDLSDFPEGPWRPGWCWYGRIEVAASNTDGPSAIDGTNTEYDRGDQKFLAYGLEKMLDQHRIFKSKWKGLSTAVNDIDSGLTFNKDGVGNRSENRTTLVRGRFGERDYHVFRYYPDGNTFEWSTRDIVRYLVRSDIITPTDNTGTHDVFRIEIDDADLERLPDWDAPELETHGVKAKAILDALISRRRLYTWWLEFSEEEADVIKLRVGTFTGSAYTLDDDSVIPANPNLIAIDTRDVNGSVQIEQEDVSHAVDQVVAYGAKRTTTFTGSFGERTDNAEFIKSWTTESEQKYEIAGSDQPGYPDPFELLERKRWHNVSRSQPELADVWSRWQLNLDINFPIGDPDDYVGFPGEIQIQPRLKLRSGVDYAGTLIGGQAVVFPENETDPLPPLVSVQVPSSVGGDAKFRFVTDIGRGANLEVDDERDTEDWTASVRASRNGRSLGIRVNGAPQHVIADTSFTGRPEDADEQHGQWDWQTMEATVTIEDDRYATGIYPENVIPDVSAVRTMRIKAGSEYRVDYVSKDTVVAIDDDGTKKTTTTGGYLQDDREKLATLAEQAYQWYSRTRRSIQIKAPYDTPWEAVKVGHFITKASRLGQYDYDVNSMVTQLTVEVLHGWGDRPQRELPPARVTMDTSFGELDFLRLIRR